MIKDTGQPTLLLKYSVVILIISPKVKRVATIKKTLFCSCILPQNVPMSRNGYISCQNTFILGENPWSAKDVPRIIIKPKKYNRFVINSLLV